jgi:selenide,water dikinase
MSAANGLLSFCSTGGCGSKLDPAVLAQFLDKLPNNRCEQLMVGFETSDDAAVWRLSSEEAIISTADFFPPMVDDGRLFGRIAAANALSDVYAMGGRPIMALNLVCFPQKMDPQILAEILAGGAEVLLAAGAFLAGGHSIYDPEPKYGLAVTGLVHPQKIRRNHTVRDGDALILTKALGVGLILSANRIGAAKQEDFDLAVKSMTHLNRKASEAMSDFSVSAATDITGFGLLGHLNEMAGKEHSIFVNYDSLPVLPGALHYAQEFFATALGQRNRNYLTDRVELCGLDTAREEILFDPQTSGGLVISLPPNQAQDLLASLQKSEPQAAIIGQVARRGPNDRAVVVL